MKPLKQLAFGHFSTDFRFFDRFRIPLTPRSFWAALHLHRTNRRREKPTVRVVYRVIVVKKDPRKLLILLLSLDFWSDFKLLTPKSRCYYSLNLPNSKMITLAHPPPFLDNIPKDFGFFSKSEVRKNAEISFFFVGKVENQNKSESRFRGRHAK